LLIYFRGDDVAATNLVLVPGLVCDVEIWRHQIDHLGDLANIIVPPATDGDSMQEMAARALEDCPSEFALAGFSMGGYIALEMMRRASGRITKLALLDASARADTQTKAQSRKAAIAACEAGDFSDVIEGMLKILLHPDHQHPPHTDFVRAMSARVGAEAFARRHKVIGGRPDSRELLANLEIPVRAVFGRQDAMSTLEEHEEMARLPKNGRLSIIEDCGHMTIRERPYAATALLRDWLLYD